MIFSAGSLLLLIFFGSFGNNNSGATSIENSFDEVVPKSNEVVFAGNHNFSDRSVDESFQNSINSSSAAIDTPSVVVNDLVIEMFSGKESGLT